jgi:hypothetical protein
METQAGPTDLALPNGFIGSLLATSALLDAAPRQQS